MKIATLTFMLFLAWTQTASDHNMGRGGQMALTLEQVKPVMQKYVDDWKSRNPQNPLWVSLASPGDPINVPGVKIADIPGQQNICSRFQSAMSNPLT
jgi:hypothetical protein